MEERKKASDYPQELLDLFHKYQHGDTDRRTFLEQAKKVRRRRRHGHGAVREPQAQLRMGAAGAEGRQRV